MLGFSLEGGGGSVRCVVVGVVGGVGVVGVSESGEGARRATRRPAVDKRQRGCRTPLDPFSSPPLPLSLPVPNQDARGPRSIDPATNAIRHDWGGVRWGGVRWAGWFRAGAKGVGAKASKGKLGPPPDDGWIRPVSGEPTARLQAKPLTRRSDPFKRNPKAWACSCFFLGVLIRVSLCVWLCPCLAGAFHNRCTHPTHVASVAGSDPIFNHRSAMMRIVCLVVSLIRRSPYRTLALP